MERYKLHIFLRNFCRVVCMPPYLDHTNNIKYSIQKYNQLVATDTDFLETIFCIQFSLEVDLISITLKYNGQTRNIFSRWRWSRYGGYARDIPGMKLKQNFFQTWIDFTFKNNIFRF